MLLDAQITNRSAREKQVTVGLLLDTHMLHRAAAKKRNSVGIIYDSQIQHPIPLMKKVSWQLTTRIHHRVPARHSKGYQLLLSTDISHKDVRHGGHGYIAGTADGIVTVGGRPAKRELWLLSLKERRIIRSTWSDRQGRYLIRHLDPKQEYLLMARDYERHYEPFCYDYLKPATDLTTAEQLALWQQWQSENQNTQ